MFSRHLKSSSTVKYCLYYGKGRASILDSLEKFQLVITTYSVVRKDWKASKTDSGPEIVPNLHTISWGRIVLDEGKLAPIMFLDHLAHSAI